MCEMNKHVTVLAILLVGFVKWLPAQTAAMNEMPVRIMLEMSTCHSFVVDEKGVLAEGKPVTGNYRITFEPETHRWGESVMKKGYNSFQSIVSRLQPDVKIHFRGNDISMKLTDHRGRLIKMDGKGRVYVFDTAQKGRVYTDTEGQNMLNITDADGRTMAKNYILGLRDLFRQIDYYRVVVTKE